MKVWCIRWKKDRSLATVTQANILAIFETQKAARAFQVCGTVVVPLRLPGCAKAPARRVSLL